MKTSVLLNKLSGKNNKLKIFHKVSAKSVILILFILCPFLSYGQKDETDRELTPIRGNYKIFAALSSQRKSTNLDVDKLKFPFSRAWADKALSVKPVYLKNISIDDFKLPDPPANSSDQTRAELNYLLTLQHNRTAEDISSSLYMSNNQESPSDIGRLIGYWTEPQKLPLTDSLME